MKRLMAPLLALLLCLPASATTWYIHSGNAAGGRNGTAGQAKLFLPELCNSSDLVFETRLVTATSTGAYFEKGT